ncbi:MAG: M1 family aminopeptidase [Bacteroidota bacterium]
MNHSFLILIFCILGMGLQLFAQERLPDPQIDILHYNFQLEMSASTDLVKGQTEVTVRFPQAGTEQLVLDLDDRGMTVGEVRMNKESLTFSHKQERLQIQLPTPSKSEDTVRVWIQYEGTPEDGLIISKNKYGDRTFFGDNWPNRAHYWLPTVDHPADKAFCDFIVIAPDAYQVVANGELVEESDLSAGMRLTHWRSTVALPTKVMVMGAARFAVQYVGKVDGIPISSWVYPQDRDKGFFDYALAMQVVAMMAEYIGPYPYAKLANVQSKTRYGGMENASNIFYSESSVTGDRRSETLIAHEIAHQWFGNSASEASWFHIWLSEGFATYFTSLYMEATYGREPLLTLMQANRTQILSSSASRKPVVDPSVTDLNALLNTNSYQKGAWILHMLRRKIGDEDFQQSVRTYYETYQFSNALSKDFQEVVEEVSGQQLDAFFQQWLYQPGFPVLETDWTYDAKKKSIQLSIKQTQKGKLYQFPLDIRLDPKVKGTSIIQKLEISEKEESFSIKVPWEPYQVVLDPDTWLLFKEE